MSVLDTNFDSPREMPTRADWLDSASTQLLNDNSYFNNATKGAEPAWLGKVELFDSARMPAAYEDAPAGDPVPVPKEPTPDVPPEPPHAPEGKPVVEIELVPAGEPPPAGPRVVDDVAGEPVTSLPGDVVPEPREPAHKPASETEAEPSAPLPPIGPRAVEGPPPPGSAPAGLPGNGPPEHTGPSLPYTSRSEKREWEAKQRAELIAQQQAAAANSNDAGPGPDGRNADGTYGAGHHPYTPAPDRDTRSTEEMTKYYEELHQKRIEEAAPYVPQRRVPTAALQALAAAAKRMGLGNGPSHTGNPGESVAHADPNYVPGPAGSFGGLRGRRGG